MTDRVPAPVSDAYSAPLQRASPSVAVLMRDVADSVAARFGVCAVHGEVSSFSRVASGHCYFNLKDSDGASAVIRCAMFRRAASLLAFIPRDGQLVELRGRLGVYESRGELQFVVEGMQRAGAGALYEKFLQSQARLEAEGLFDVASRRPIPPYPRSIGIVTSLGGAALHDVLSALARRAPHVRSVVYPSPVQGAEAPMALVAAISTASRRAEVDLLIVCRGGGSLEDLWAFNDERVVRAVRACAVPVVCGVGHETDVTLADLAADLRAPTPTAAAELAAPRRQVCLDVLDALEHRLRQRARDAIDSAGQRLDRCALRLARPTQGMRRRQERLTLLAHRLADHLPRALSVRRVALDGRATRLGHLPAARTTAGRQRLAALESRLRALDPSQVLARGFAWLTDADGAPVMSVDRLADGDRLTAVLYDGTADVHVVEVLKPHGGRG